MIDELLREKHACGEAIAFCKEKSWQEIYDTCPRGDWMLWLFARTSPDDLKLLTLAKGHCANTVRHLMKDERSIRAVDIAISFGEGMASKIELDAASAASDAAAAAYAAYAASAAAAAAYAAYASDAAAYAAYASDADARAESQKRTADICRKCLPIEIWNIKECVS